MTLSSVFFCIPSGRKSGAGTGLPVLLVSSFLFSLLVACKKEAPLRLAYDQGDPDYQKTAGLLKQAMASDGYELRLVPVENAIQGAAMVAQGDAELSLIMDQSDLEPELKEDVFRLRTIAPLFRRVIYLFHRPEIPYEETFLKMIRDRDIFTGTVGGEKHSSFLRFMDFAGFSDFRISADSTNADVIFFWGDTNGERAEALARQGWKIYSIREIARKSISLRLGRLQPYDLPPTPSMQLDSMIKTLSSNVLLITSGQTDTDRTYRFAKALFKARSRMIVHNPIFEQMVEDFNPSTLPYPLSDGMEAYLRRDEPTFWERYAEVIALIFGVLATLSGVIQSVRLWIHRRRKERLDQYLRRFADAKNTPDKENLLEEILDNALVHLTQERLEKEDFDILARLIYSEMTAKKRLEKD